MRQQTACGGRFHRSSVSDGFLLWTGRPNSNKRLIEKVSRKRDDNARHFGNHHKGAEQMNRKYVKTVIRNYKTRGCIERQMNLSREQGCDLIASLIYLFANGDRDEVLNVIDDAFDSLGNLEHEERVLAAV